MFCFCQEWIKREELASKYVSVQFNVCVHTCLLLLLLFLFFYSVLSGGKRMMPLFLFFSYKVCCVIFCEGPTLAEMFLNYFFLWFL